MNSEQHQHTQEDSGNTLDPLFEEARKAEEKYTPDVSHTEAAYRKVAKDAGLPSSKSVNANMKWAAAAAILITALSIGYLLTPRQVTVPNGHTETITLADGTVVTLNSGSQLSYARWFNIWGRTVTLDGEAFFEVISNGTPFQVKAGPGTITVMGTKFNVRSWSSDEQRRTSVFLQEGRVALSSRNEREQNQVILQPGEYSWLSAGNAPSPPQPTATSKATAWMQDGLSFENQPLSAIFDEIRRRFDVSIQVQPETLLEEKLTIYLSRLESAQQAIRDICQAKGLEYSRQDSEFKVTRSL